VVYAAIDRTASSVAAYNPCTNLSHLDQDYCVDQKFSQGRLMRKIAVVFIGALVLFVLFRLLARTPAPTPVCPRGYDLVPGPNSYAGNPRVCMPRGEYNSENAIPAVNYIPPLDASVMQSF